MFSFFQQHKAATTVAGLAMAKTLVDNYWIFTNIPLVGGSDSEVASKFFYLLAELSLAAGLGGALGHVIDKLNTLPEQLNRQGYSNI
jgi:hypothetical protein